MSIQNIMSVKLYDLLKYHCNKCQTDFYDNKDKCLNIKLCMTNTRLIMHIVYIL